jgi:hypothetical protein
MNIQALQKVLIFIGLLILSFTADSYTSYYVIIGSSDIYRAVVYNSAIPPVMREILISLITYFSHMICLSLFGVLLGIFYYEHKRLFLITMAFAMFHIAKIVIVSILTGLIWVNPKIYSPGYLIVFFLDICLTYAGAALSRYFIKKAASIKEA